MTVTGGGNDLIATVNDGTERLGFSGVLQACLTTVLTDCTVRLDATAARAAVGRLYSAIKQRLPTATATGIPVVYVMLYQRIFGPNGCAGISPTEATRINTLSDQ